MTKYQLIEDVTRGPILSAYVTAPFDKGKKLLESKGYRIASLEENARLRMQKGPKSKVSRCGSRVLEDAIYVPEGGVFLTKKSPIMDNAKNAVKEQRNMRDFYLDDVEDVEKYLDDAVRLDSKSIPANKYGIRYIPTNRFNEFEITRYAFGKSAEDYGKFLKKDGINEMPICLADMQDKPFARKVWFWGLDNWSDLFCDNRSLFYDVMVRGVKMSAKGANF